MFESVLIANRGEIACRVIDTARRLGIRSIAVYSEADRDALHVHRADLAVPIGPAPAAQSYLCGERIIEAALRSDARAIHPGYGFLSENAAFARACEDAELVFIGPPPAAIEAMGSKSRAKTIMEAAGVPLIPGYHGEDQSDEVLEDAAQAMGYPVLLKATAGGGGKGMRAVYAAPDFAEALAAARREATASFGDDRMLIEKLLERPRHVEVQIFCDAQGGAVYLSDRDCSIQRRHQKVIEEAPAPGLSEELRRAMGQAAVTAARAIDYRGAGTIEYLVDAQHDFYFMEMNTRLQVEHPVTEWVTRQDLVEWQLRIAAGEALPLTQEAIRVTGHAIEARVYAEDPDQGFLPSTGRIHHLATPPLSPELRIDSGVAQGSDISTHYDPMIAKVISGGASREEARRTLINALRRYEVAGVATNLAFLSRIARSDGFRDGDLDTSFIERYESDLFAASETQHVRDLSAATVVLHERRRAANAKLSHEPFSPWSDSRAWRLNLLARQTFDVEYAGASVSPRLTFDTDGATVYIDDTPYRLRWRYADGRLDLEVDGQSHRATIATFDSEITLFWDTGPVVLHEHRREVVEEGAAAGSADFAAPMHGTVVAHLAEAGSHVAAGDGVIVLEAMKMEHTLRAPVDGQINAFLASPGDLVDRGVTLVDFTADAAR